MKVIGLTGGIACGKSTVSNYLKELGAVIIDGDIIAREISDSSSVLEELFVSFGGEVLSSDKTLNRRALGNLVFNDSEAMAKLNNIIHPKVEEAIKLSIQHYKTQGFNGVVILDIPLLIEIKLFERIKMDELWLVSVNYETQLKRLMERNDFNSTEADVRIKSQLPLEEKAKFVDVIIDNSLDIDHLRTQIKLNYERMI